jgi:poly-gamma-glutamate capsule biosynthesis protein CapA/YwtB (metallophosphatase superfamily)
MLQLLGVKLQYSMGNFIFVDSAENVWCFNTYFLNYVLNIETHQSDNLKLPHSNAELHQVMTNEVPVLNVYIYIYMYI